ncbi:MAG: hypothetical protein C7B45_09810 [Sulfobacillus acidophilus]|uniref:Dihydrodipicolinate synthase family protein n=1 Tax=Sulfobacillus acidophilus TaxID=53633 RepID=A0A2T2WHJ0_9FIRM|nr:MAG: hypothetical protein C7B45_09810 [Sulfobacillus acidophilus]
MLPDGIIASSVTPFFPNGDVAYNLLTDHINWLLEEGVDGLSPLGSSGEFAALDINTRKQVLEHVIEINAGRRPIIAGTHHYSTQATIELSIHAERAGADALLITPPYYMSPSVPQVMDHYRAIADAVTIPIVLYHNMANTHVDLKTEHLTTLFEENAIAGVKMSNAESDRIGELLMATGNACTVYAGIDVVAFDALCLGATGWISGIPSIVPKAAHRLYDAIRNSDLALARREWNTLAPLMRLEFRGYLYGDGDPHWFSVMKAALNLIGPCVNDPLPPIQPLAEPKLSQLKALLANLGYAVR